jgi:hypothetical protein
VAPPDGSAPLPSVATTGGVYKWQGRIQGALMTHTYKAFLVQGRQLQSSIPRTTQSGMVSHPLQGNPALRALLDQTPWLCQCSARAAQDIWEHHRPAVVSRMLALFGIMLSTSEKLVDPATRGILAHMGGAPTPRRASTQGAWKGPIGGGVAIHPTWVLRDRS